MRNQLLLGSTAQTPAQVVAAVGALQAQDYAASLWSVGVRLAATTEKAVERAILDRKIVRTWAMRGTWHLVPAPNVRWMLRHLSPRVIAAAARREKRDLGLDGPVLARARKVLTRAFRDGGRIARDDLYARLERAKIRTDGQRGYHILWHLAQEGLTCFSGRIGRQPSFALLDEWLPGGDELDRETALAELARCFYRSHGPATIADFAWWVGIGKTEARATTEAIARELDRHVAVDRTYWSSPCEAGRSRQSGAMHLLPSYDEYILGYSDRSAVLDAQAASKVMPPGGGAFRPCVLKDGRAVGIWRREVTKKSVAITIDPLSPLTGADRRSLANAAQRFGEFLGQPVAIKNGKM